MLLILKQPDFSTALTFLPMITGMLFCAGADVLQLLFVFGFGAATLTLPLVYTLCQVRFPERAAGQPAGLRARRSRRWAGPRSRPCWRSPPSRRCSGGC